MTDWLAIRVELVSGPALEFDPRPGRVYLVGAEHTFADLAEAIEASFGRWEPHLHAFEMADGTTIGPVDPDGELDFVDQDKTCVSSTVEVGDGFTYIFDFGDEWRHECVVEEPPAEAMPEEGEDVFLERPVPIFGWGWLPDQYGRRAESSEEPEFD